LCRRSRDGTLPVKTHTLPTLSLSDLVLICSRSLPNNSLERTQPGRDVMYDVAMLRRSARGR
jgi:hypothetical protein